MRSEKVRISKAPEVREQEILDTAMQVFAEKGYEQTTMRDIAAAVGVVPGLCYRYFESKQKLYQCAIQRYVTDYCAPVVGAIEKYGSDVDGLARCVTDLFVERDGREKYHAFFHQQKNRGFHRLLSCELCDYMQPHVKRLLDRLNREKVTSIEDTSSCAQFMLYGQMGIICDECLSVQERAERIRAYVSKLLI